MSTTLLVVALVSSVAAVVFSSLHLALTTLARSGLETVAAVEGRAGATARVRKILEDVDGHSRAVALGRAASNVVCMLAVLMWVVLLFGLARVVEVTGEPSPVPALAPTAWIPVLTALVSSILWLWLVSVLIPTSAASHAGERLVYFGSILVRVTYLLERPLDPVIRFIDEVVRRLVGAERASDTETLEAELLSIIEEGEREGAIEETEKEMIEAVVKLRSTSVEHVMTPRTEIDALEETDDLAEIVAFIRREGHSRVPVFERDLDHILGILYAKDLLSWVTNGHEAFKVREVVRPALFVPETKTVNQLLQEFISKEVHLAMVADEYGGTAGLITIEDIVEEVFGDIRDEFEPDDEEEPRIDVDEEKRTAVVDARAYIDDVNDALEPLGIALPEDDDYDTLAGFVLAELGEIPDVGDTLRHGRALLTVLEAEATRVLRVGLQIRPEDEIDDTPEDVEMAAGEERDATRT